MLCIGMLWPRRHKLGPEHKKTVPPSSIHSECLLSIKLILKVHHYKQAFLMCLVSTRCLEARERICMHFICQVQFYQVCLPFSGVAIFTADLIWAFPFLSHPLPDAAQFPSLLLAYNEIFCLSWHVVSHQPAVILQRRYKKTEIQIKPQERNMLSWFTHLHLNFNPCEGKCAGSIMCSKSK